MTEEYEVDAGGSHHLVGRFEKEEEAMNAYLWAMEEVELTGTYTKR